MVWKKLVKRLRMTNQVTDRVVQRELEPLVFSSWEVRFLVFLRLFQPPL